MTCSRTTPSSPFKRPLLAPRIRRENLNAIAASRNVSSSTASASPTSSSAAKTANALTAPTCSWTLKDYRCFVNRILRREQRQRAANVASPTAKKNIATALIADCPAASTAVAKTAKMEDITPDFIVYLYGQFGFKLNHYIGYFEWSRLRTHPKTQSKRSKTNSGKTCLLPPSWPCPSWHSTDTIGSICSFICS